MAPCPATTPVSGIYAGNLETACGRDRDQICYDGCPKRYIWEREANDYFEWIDSGYTADVFKAKALEDKHHGLFRN